MHFSIFLKHVTIGSKLPSFPVGGNAKFRDMEFITSRIFQSPRDLQNAQIMEVPLAIIHLLILVTTGVTTVLASMVSQWFSHASGCPFSIPCLKHRSLWWSWQILHLSCSHYHHSKVLTNQLSLAVSGSLSSYSVSSKTGSPYEPFLGTKHASSRYLYSYQKQQVHWLLAISLPWKEKSFQARNGLLAWHGEKWEDENFKKSQQIYCITVVLQFLCIFWPLQPTCHPL